MSVKSDFIASYQRENMIDSLKVQNLSNCLVKVSKVVSVKVSPKVVSSSLP